MPSTEPNQTADKCNNRKIKEKNGELGNHSMRKNKKLLIPNRTPMSAAWKCHIVDEKLGGSRGSLRLAHCLVDGQHQEGIEGWPDSDLLQGVEVEVFAWDGLVKLPLGGRDVVAREIAFPAPGVGCDDARPVTSGKARAGTLARRAPTDPCKGHEKNS
jgi:hypothetical protein